MKTTKNTILLLAIFALYCWASNEDYKDAVASATQPLHIAGEQP